ncbi:MAG: CotH kinase family protein, partial [Flavobacteriales bacterium]|nr:CotH kinase family protein [Flavobacteriales bacterium]
SNGYMNNTKFWHNDEPGGKWRFMLMDLDFGMGEWPCVDYIVRAGDDWFETDQIFAHLKLNPEFRDRFVLRYFDLVNTVFQTENFTAIRDQMRDELNDAMPRHCQRWGTDYNGWYYGYDGRLNWNNERLACIDDVIQSHFGLNNLLNVTLDVQPAGAGRIHISTVEPTEDQYPWTGTYVNGIPVQITAIANPGYTFDYWEANDLFPVNASVKQFVLNLESDITFRAHFSGENADDAIRVSEFMYHPDDANVAGDWVEVHNPLDVPLDLSSMDFKDQNYFNKFEIPLNTMVPAGGYLVLAEEPAQFAVQYPEVTNVTGPWNFELNDDSDVLNFYYYDGSNALSIAYTDDSPWPAGSDGTGRSVEFDTLQTDLLNPLNWFPGCIGGSPGTAYDLLCGEVNVDELGSSEYSLFPNPADESVNIIFPPHHQAQVINVIADDGSLVAQWRVPASSGIATYDVSSLAPGLYTLHGDGMEVMRLVVH